jgi:EmrB/QacA subfamily drug resistance transporter
VLAVFLLGAGKIADLVGRKTVFLVGIVVFTAASIACGLSGDISTLIAARAIQGVGAAIIMPTTLSIISVTFAPKYRGAALGIWSAVMGLGAAIGPLVGGLLTEELEWNWIFYVNAPIGVFVLVWGLLFVDQSKDPSPDRSFDLPGLVVSGIALFSLTFGLLQGNDYGWTDPRIVGLFALSIICFALLVVIEKRVRIPMIELSLFRSSTYTGANILGAIATFVLLGVVFFVSVYMQGTLGYTPTETGLRFLPLTLLIMAASIVAGRTMGRIGPRPFLTSGFAILVFAFLAFSRLDYESEYVDLLPGLTLAAV